jgi:hypothetical protein
MIYLVYVRWPDQTTSEKTATASRAVAEFAFAELRALAPTFARRGAVGISFSGNCQRIDFVNLIPGAVEPLQWAQGA